MTSTFANSTVPFLDMAANQMELGNKIAEQMKPVFAGLGLQLDSFVVENLSLPEELQPLLDQKIGMNMIGDMNRYTQFQAAQAIPLAAKNEGGGAGLGAGLGAGMAIGQQMMNAMRPQAPAAPEPAPPPPAAPASSSPAAAAGADSKFCIDCGKAMPKRAKFCPECGAAQQ
jgi:membrane protease subunit (stomatin/prohibitin family)